MRQALLECFDAGVAIRPAAEGVIMGVEEDQRIRRALRMVPTISFYRYQTSFKLVKG